jgi:hypothetical protein
MALLGGVGCTNIHPTGPLAKVTGTPKTGPAIGPLAKDTTAPTTVQAQRPPRPAEMITPGEVSADNATAAARKLMSELEMDGKSVPNVSHRSVYKGGVKVE